MPNYDAVSMPHFERTRTQPEAGERPGIDSLVGAHYEYVRRLALSILDDAHEAEDAAQEAFIAAARALPGFRGQSAPKTWLTAITVNVCRGRLRRWKRRLALQAALQALHLSSEPHADPEGAAIQNEADSQLWREVDALDEKHRLPVVLRYVHELTIPEIAASLSLSEGTVHSRLHYARQKLLSRLGRMNPQAEVVDESA